MSLINEALKKAQKQRQDEATAAADKVATPRQSPPEAPPPPPPPVIAPAAATPDPDPEPDLVLTARQKRGARANGLRNGVLAGLVVLGVIVVFLFKEEAEPVSANSESVTLAEKPLVAPPETTRVEDGREFPAPPIEAPSAPDELPTTSAPRAVSIENETVPDRVDTPPVVAVTLPVGVSSQEAGRMPPPVQIESAPRSATVPTAPPPSPAAQSRDPVTPAATGSVTIISERESQPTAHAISASQPSLMPSETVLNYLERSRVTGVRASATDPKVLMNNRVFRLNEVVDRDLQLRVIGIEPRQLKFRDPQGYIYTKSF